MKAKYADPEFDDSFTVYRALINKVCVCKGYAEAFKLLNNYFSKDELSQTFTSTISSSFDEIILHTNFDITDNELYEIFDYVASNSSTNVAFNYMSWLGVIYIKPN